MKTIATFVKRHPLLTYFVLTYAFSWAMVALYSAGFIFALLALFRLALAAISVGLVASLILGVRWAGWHLANATIPGLQYYLYGFPAFLFFVVAQTVLFTWLFNHARGSVLLAWIFHAWINISNSLVFVGDQITQGWLVGAGFALVANVVLLVQGPNLARDTVALSREPQSIAVQS